MKLSLNEVAKLLNMPEATIQRWVRKGNIPAIEIGGQYVFIKKDLEKWARLHNIVLNIHPEKDAQKLSPIKISVSEAMERGGIFFNLKGEDVNSVLKSVVNLAPLPPEIDRDTLLERLVQREELASTGIGDGVAIPHPRSPLENPPQYPFITTGFLEKEIDFHAIDGIPVFVLFMMLSPNTKAHLELLSRLSFFLRDKSFISFLKSCSKAESLLLKVKEMEKRIDISSTMEKKNSNGET